MTNEDIGLPDEAKAQLGNCIREVIRRQRLTQNAAAARMGIDQPKVSAILNGNLYSFSSDRLMRLLLLLGMDIEIMVKTTSRIHGQIRVFCAIESDDNQEGVQ